jgi:hypothetical protein
MPVKLGDPNTNGCSGDKPYPLIEVATGKMVACSGPDRATALRALQARNMAHAGISKANGENIMSITGFRVSKQISTADWSAVDKSKLPAECFLWVEDPAQKATWHLPVYEGAGVIGVDGMYMKRGALNANAVRAAMAAIGGARSGSPMRVPMGVVERAQSLMRQVQGQS